ncbi:MAG: O-antigen polysaccharide polymerase Wzy [Desulfosporosinus sp.]
MLLSKRKTLTILSFMFISLIFNILFLYTNTTYEYTEWIRIIPIIVIIHAVLSIVHFRLLSISLFSLSTMFVLLLYIFHFGEVIAFGVFEHSGVTNSILLYPSSIYKSAIYSCFIIINCTSLGMMLSVNRVSKEGYNILTLKGLDLLSISDTKNCRTIGLIILFLTFPLRLYIDTGNILTGLREGYLSTYEKMMPGVFYSFSELYITGFALMLMSTRYQAKKQTAIFIVMVLYLTLTMFSGHRLDAVCYIITISYIYYMNREHRKKVKIVSVFLLVLLAYLGVNLLLTVSEIRNQSNINLDMIRDTFRYFIFDRNPIVDLLYQFGETVYTPIATVFYINEFSKYTYGLTYILSFVNAFPNIGGIFTTLSQKAMYGLELQNTGVLLGSQNIGGSYIGELIFNFGRFSVLFSLIFGVVIQKISEIISHKAKSRDYIVTAYYVPVFWGMLGLVRGYSSTLVRAIVWGILLVYIVKAFVYRKK